MASHRHTVLIFNPFAGGLRRRRSALDRAIKGFEARGMTVEAIPTTGPRAATGIARDAIERGADLILVAGGDGTINEVVNGMAHSAVPLGILPCGTANVLANELELGNTMERAAESMFEAVEARVALGLLATSGDETPRHFLLMAGAGLDADIVYHINVRTKAALGKVAYWIGGFGKVGRRLPEFSAEIDGRRYETSFALVSRVRNYGGDLTIAPTICLLDDEFEVVLFEGQSSFRYLKYMLGMLTRRLTGMRGVTIVRARTVVLSAPVTGKIYIQVDGEHSGFLPARMEIVPNALTLLVPPGFHTRKAAIPEDAAWTTSPTR